jgi:hypothetical protein
LQISALRWKISNAWDVRLFRLNPTKPTLTEAEHGMWCVGLFQGFDLLRR